MDDIKKPLTPLQLQRISELEHMSPGQWDALCRRCGMCCLIKMGAGRHKILYTRLCCENLDCSTQLCKVYSTRFCQTNVLCEKVNIKTILEGELLPASCAYVEYVFGPARHAAKVDFANVSPLNSYKLSRLSFSELMRFAIRDSIRWGRY